MPVRAVFECGEITSFQLCGEPPRLVENEHRRCCQWQASAFVDKDRTMPGGMNPMSGSVWKRDPRLSPCALQDPLALWCHCTRSGHGYVPSRAPVSVVITGFALQNSVARRRYFGCRRPRHYPASLSSDEGYVRINAHARSATCHGSQTVFILWLVVPLETRCRLGCPDF